MASREYLVNGTPATMPAMTRKVSGNVHNFLRQYAPKKRCRGLPPVLGILGALGANSSPPIIVSVSSATRLGSSADGFGWVSTWIGRRGRYCGIGGDCCNFGTGAFVLEGRGGAERISLLGFVFFGRNMSSIRFSQLLNVNCTAYASLLPIPCLYNN